MHLECFDTGILDSNCYVLWDGETNEGVVIDAGVDSVQIANFITENNINIKYIILTHCHFDHMYFVKALKKITKAKTAIHKNDASGFTDPKVNCSARFGHPMTFGEADIILDDKSTLSIGDITLEILHTPGHSAGCISIKVNEFIFTGDTLFKGSVGRVDLPFSSPSDIVSSVQDRLYLLPGDTIIFPGHGSSSTIGYEILNNSVLKGKSYDS